MDALIPIHNQGTDFLVDSRDVAKLFSVTHEHLRDQIEEHQPEMQRLGVFRVEAGKPQKNSSGGRPQKYYWLNFDQVVYLLTLTKSTAETREFRVRLILAFRTARERLRPVDVYLLSIPEKWRKTFKDEFYISLLRIYGEAYDASKNKPSWVGGWTNRFVYEPIFVNLSKELKSKREKYCGSSGKDGDWIRLHQFLEDNAKDELKDHITKITLLLQMSGSKLEFAEYFKSAFHGVTQLKWDDLLDESFGNN